MPFFDSSSLPYADQIRSVVSGVRTAVRTASSIYEFGSEAAQLGYETYEYVNNKIESVLGSDEVERSDNLAAENAQRKKRVLKRRYKVNFDVDKKNTPNVGVLSENDLAIISKTPSDSLTNQAKDLFENGELVFPTDSSTQSIVDKTKLAQDVGAQEIDVPANEENLANKSGGGADIKEAARSGNTTATTTIAPVIQTNRKGLEDLRLKAADQDPKSRRLRSKNNRGQKTFDFITDVGGVAILSLIPEGGNGIADPQKINGFFLLENFNEKEASRNEFVSTQDVDIINLFGKEINIWTYGGVTLNGGVGNGILEQGASDAQGRRNFATNFHTNWYERFAEFMSQGLGFPRIDNKRHFMRLEYQNFVREGFLLDINYLGNSQSDKLVRFNFTMAVSDFYTVPSKGGERNNNDGYTSRGSFKNYGFGVLQGSNS